MSERPPYCLSRQHPELASRSPAETTPIAHRDLPPAPVNPPQNQLKSNSEGRPGKGL
jgi:hypothetical protein